MKQLIYLDNNATTPIDTRVLEDMMPFLTTNFANANSSHHFGVGAFEAVKAARAQVAQLLNADSHELVFTSGATEAINLAVKGIAESQKNKGKHIITVATEHSAMLDTCKHLEAEGFNITYLSVNSEGLIDLEELKSVISKDTILVSVMWVNNETGTIQPIKIIAEIAHENGAFFLTDATQAVGKMPINVRDYNIDLLTFSGHKLYAPKGVGGLFLNQSGEFKVKIPALLHGGGHERGFRSGTLNVPGIVAMGKAFEIARKEMQKNAVHIEKVRNYLENELLKLENTKINGSKESRIFSTSNICFNGVDSDAIIMGLSNPENDLPLIAVSNGSACTSTSIEPSHVLMAMGLSETEAFNSIRFSIGKDNTIKEIDVVIESVKNVIYILRAFVS